MASGVAKLESEISSDLFESAGMRRARGVALRARLDPLSPSHCGHRIKAEVIGERVLGAGDGAERRLRGLTETHLAQPSVVGSQRIASLDEMETVRLHYGRSQSTTVSITQKCMVFKNTL